MKKICHMLFSMILVFGLFISCKTTQTAITENNSEKESLKEGLWSFDVQKGTADITYYAGKTDSIVIIPSVLGGKPVTAISSQAFGHHGEIQEVYVPSSVMSVADWAFYDLNTASLISFANANVNISDGAFQSSANAALYLPSDTTLKKAGGKTVVTKGTKLVSVKLINKEKAAIAGETYLSVNEKLSSKDIEAIAKSYDGKVIIDDSSVTFTGDDYVIQTKKKTIAKGLRGKVSVNDLNHTFRSLTKNQAEKLHKAIASDPSYSKTLSLLPFEAGYYLNGNKINLSDKATAYDVQTGLSIEKNDTNLFPSALPDGSTKYKYVAAFDTDNDGLYDVIYYSPYTVSYEYNTVNIKSNNENLNGLSARTLLNPVYESFVNGVIESRGKNIHEKDITIDTASSGKKTDSSSNEERSLVWADNYGKVTVNSIAGTSSSKANWAKMSYETGLDAYNVEIAMEWGMNALLYATDGGQINVGKNNGKRSIFTASGDGANGIIAGGTGKDAPQGKYSTSSVSVTNADFMLTGWNNHIADVVYGGYASLEDVLGTTGIKGSYAVGQASALANDFGNGVVDVNNFKAIVYGNRSAGAYVIGGGVITAKNSSFTSYADSGLVIASGGTYKISNTSAKGLIALRNRGGITPDSVSTFDNTSFTADRSLMSSYVTGSKAEKAAEAWKEASGSSDLIHFMASDPDMTLGRLCQLYKISEQSKNKLYEELGSLSEKVYTDKTLFRSSVLDNSYYNYSAGAYTGKTDYSNVPYLTEGSSFGGLVSSIFEFESSGVNLNLNNCTYQNKNGSDYNYLVASEAGSAPVLNFNGGTPAGIIYNEGDVFRFVEGRPDNRSSKLTVNFKNCTFTGSFADGSNGLWDVTEHLYTDAAGTQTTRNGNYYNARANWGITAVFDRNSSWTVTHDSYLGSLSISDRTNLKAQNGYKIIMEVNGKVVPVKACTYTGHIIIKAINK